MVAGEDVRGLRQRHLSLRCRAVELARRREKPIAEITKDVALQRGRHEPGGARCRARLD